MDFSGPGGKEVGDPIAIVRSTGVSIEMPPRRLGILYFVDLYVKNDELNICNICLKGDNVLGVHCPVS